MKHLLDNIFWHALSGPQGKFAVGDDTARRYAPGFSPILAFADQLRPDLSALAAFCGPRARGAKETIEASRAQRDAES